MFSSKFTRSDVAMIAVAAMRQAVCLFRTTNLRRAAKHEFQSGLS